MPTSKDLPRWIIFGVDRPREVARTSGVDVTRVVFLSLDVWCCPDPFFVGSSLVFIVPEKLLGRQV